MNLYDDLIHECMDLTQKSQTVRQFKKKEIASWESEDEQNLILRGDMLYELGGGMLPAVSMLAFTSQLEMEDEVVVIGEDLDTIKKDTPYARITLLKVDDSLWTDNQKASRAMRRIGYTKYHIYPKGFMMRISTSAAREPVRIGKEAVKQGLNFSRVGGTFIDAYHEHAEVQAVKIIFITDPDFPYRQLETYADKANKITKSLDTILDNLLMDCRSCAQKPICDEVDGLRKFHQTHQ